MRPIGKNIALSSATRHRRVLVIATSIATATLVALAGCSSTAGTAAPTATGDASAQVTAAQQAVTQLKAEPAPVVLSLDPLTKAADLRGKTIFVIPVASVVFSTYVTALQSAVAAVGGQIQICDGQ